MLEEGRDLPITCVFRCFLPFNEKMLEQTWASLKSVTLLRSAPQSLRLLLLAGFSSGSWCPTRFWRTASGGSGEPLLQILMKVPV